MSRWRIAVIVSLFAAPILALIGFGSYYITFEKHWGFIAWWPTFACFALAYALAWYWHRQRRLLGSVEQRPATHWTERDWEAWKLVEARAQAAAGTDVDKLAALQFYV